MRAITSRRCLSHPHILQSMHKKHDQQNQTLNQKGKTKALYIIHTSYLLRSTFHVQLNY
jgi:hypothetical protein